MVCYNKRFCTEYQLDYPHCIPYKIVSYNLLRITARITTAASVLSGMIRIYTVCYNVRNRQL